MKDSTTIALRDLLNILDPTHYKLHLATQNKLGVQPLDDFVAGLENWHGWNEWNDPRKNDWTRPFVLSFMRYYPGGNDQWLFGGGFEVIARRTDRYKLKPLAQFTPFVGRLIATFHRKPREPMRGRGFLLERYLDRFTVAEILPTIYSGEAFPGHSSVNHDFGTLEAIVRAQRKDWMSALANVKGIYLVADRSNGKKYVGAAYGADGIWSRWQAYIESGHGENVELRRILRERPAHARENFMFSILEVLPMGTDDRVVEAREKHWKEVLHSREHGYNKN